MTTYVANNRIDELDAKGQRVTFFKGEIYTGKSSESLLAQGTISLIVEETTKEPVVEAPKKAAKKEEPVVEAPKKAAKKEEPAAEETTKEPAAEEKSKRKKVVN